MPEKKLGFIGLGEMGRPMVKNLVNAGYSVIVWNRSQPGIDECVGYGATAGTSPRDAGASLPGSTLVQQLYNTTGTEEIQERGVVGLMLALEKWQQSLS